MPKPGDHYILWNISMPDSYYPMAEKELEEAVEKYNEENWLDISTYKAPTDHVWIEQKKAELYVGRRVRLESREYFPETGYRASRITKITRKVNLPSQMDIEISDALQTGALDKVNSQMGELKNYTKEQTQANSLPEIIRTGENTLPTDNNLFSARRSQKEFLSKTRPDRAAGRIIFDKGIDLGSFIQGASGGAAWQDDSGAWHIEADYLTARRKLKATAVDVQRIEHVGGQILLTAARMRADKVELINHAYRCYFLRRDTDGREVENTWQLGDQAICQTFDLARETDGTLGNRFYWRLVTGVGSIGDYHYIDLCDNATAPEPYSGRGYADGSNAPLEGDSIVQLGNRKGADGRTSAIIIAGAGTASPSIRELTGITTFALLASNMETQIKPGDNIFTGRVTIKPGSTGAANFQDLPQEISKAVDVGGVNLLRNTAFTGDYDSVATPDTQNPAAQGNLYSPWMAHWSGQAELYRATNAPTPYCVKLGSIRQQVSLEQGQSYTLSMLVTQGTAKATVSGEEMSFQPGRMAHTFRAAATADTPLTVFAPQGATATVCAIKLERGTMATDWSPSPSDPGAEADRFRALWYLSQAIKQGGTEILGGLVLASVINLGQYVNGKMQKVQAGMSGVHFDDDDIAFWAGGTLEDAIKSYQRIKKGNLTEAEWQSLVGYLVTHGGDAFFKGYVYAKGGRFRGTVEATDGIFNGTVNATDGTFNGTVNAKRGNLTDVNISGTFTSTYQSLPNNYKLEMNNASRIPLKLSYWNANEGEGSEKAMFYLDYRRSGTNYRGMVEAVFLDMIGTNSYHMLSIDAQQIYAALNNAGQVQADMTLNESCISFTKHTGGMPAATFGFSSDNFFRLNSTAWVQAKDALVGDVFAMPEEETLTIDNGDGTTKKIKAKRLYVKTANIV